MLSSYRYILMGIFVLMGVGCESPLNTAQPDPPSLQMWETLDERPHALFEITKAQLNVTEFRFETETPEDRDIEIGWENDLGVLIDLLADSIDSRLFPKLPHGPFVELEIRLEAESKNQAPTLWLEGQLSDTTGQSALFSLEIRHEFELRLEIENEQHTFYFDSGFLKAFDIPGKFSRIFHELTPEIWSTAGVNEHGILVISHDSNKAIFQEISGKLGSELKIEIKHE